MSGASNSRQKNAALHLRAEAQTGQHSGTLKKKPGSAATVKEICNPKKQKEKFMIVQLSSGQGPQECRLAVGKLWKALQKEYPDAGLLTTHGGTGNDCFDSVTFRADNHPSFPEGSVLWICQSPFRPGHRRKNWYVDISILPEAEEIPTDEIYRIEKFRCGGKGGQHVNKTETGVSVIHVPTGITAVCTEERSQYMNKQRALARIHEELEKRALHEQAKQNNNAWREHNRIVRGNPVRIYKGMEFRRVE